MNQLILRFTAVVGILLPAAVFAIRIDVDTPAKLVTAFKTAEAHPENSYEVYLKKITQVVNNKTVAKPYYITSILTLLRGSVTLYGSTNGTAPGSYIIDASKVVEPNNNKRAFYLNSQAGGSPYLTVRGVTFQGGSASNESGGVMHAWGGFAEFYYCKFIGNKANQPGGAFHMMDDGYLGVYNSLFDGNYNSQANPTTCAGGVTGIGGAITFSGQSVGYITKSTFKNNKACRGGAVVMESGSNVWIENSTFSGNIAIRSGGALFVKGSGGYHYLLFNTIKGNQAGTAPSPRSNDPHYGGGIGFWGFTGNITMVGNILAENQNVNGMPDPWYHGHDCYNLSSSFSAQFNDNLIGILDNCTELGSDLWARIGWQGAPWPSGLGTFKTNGATTGFQMETYMPNFNSDAIGNYWSSGNWGNTDGWGCLYDDQRGYKRSTSGRCDIGAIEYGGVP